MLIFCHLDRNTDHHELNYIFYCLAVGKGYCGPAFCDNVPNTIRTCDFGTVTTPNWATEVAKIQSKTCTQSTDSRCTSAYLASVIRGTGVKAAYCNDAFLVINGDGSGGFATHLNNITFPPGKPCLTLTLTLVLF
jgi:hypothetical protein